MTLFDIRVTTTVNRRVVGSSPTGGAKKSRKKQRALRSAPSEQGDYVSDRKGRWFESNRGSQEKALANASAFSIKRTFGA